VLSYRFGRAIQSQRQSPRFPRSHCIHIRHPGVALANPSVVIDRVDTLLDGTHQFSVDRDRIAEEVENGAVRVNRRG
jgi:hypothetical protein